MECPSFPFFEESQESRMESMLAAAGRIEVEARKLLLDFASRHGLSQVEAATCILWNRDCGHQTSIFDTMVLEEIENYAQQQLKMFFEQQSLTCELSHYTPLVDAAVTDGLLSFLQENGANGSGSVSSLLDSRWRELYMHRSPHLTRADYGFNSNTTPYLLDIGGRGSSRMHNWSAEAHPTVRAGSTGLHTFIDIDALLHFMGEEPRETAPGYVWVGPGDSYCLSSNISPRGHDTMLEHTPATGDGEAGGSPIFLGIGGRGSSRMHYYRSPEAHDTVRAGITGHHHTFIDIPAHLHFLGEEPTETDSENAWASRILETTIGALLPAAAVNARDFFSAAPDIVRLAGNAMLPALLGLCLIGMIHKRTAGRVLRLATCAGIAATTLGVSSQLSGGIYIFIAAVAGVGLSFITLTA